MPDTAVQTIREHLAEISLTAGATTVGYATIDTNPTLAVAGLALIVIGATAAALRAIRDTGRERDRLQRVVDEAQAERAKYVAARALVDRDAEYVCEQMEKNERETAAYIAAETERLQAQVAAEREELLAEIEDKRSAIKREGFLIGLDAGTRGVVFEPARPSSQAVVIQMPRAAVGSEATTAGQN